MVEFDISDLHFYIINLKEDEQKRRFMEDQMIRFNFKFEFIEGIKITPRPIGIALSHLKVLKQKGLKAPFVVLEDDCEFFEKLVELKIKLPSNCDALYLGHSTFGVREKDQYGLQWGKENAAQYSIYDDNYIRIHSMLSRHAIIYISEKFHQNTIEANLRALTNFAFPYPGDMAYQQIQNDHLILAPKNPWCYQSEKFRGNHPATKVSIMEKIKPIEHNG